MRHPIPASFVQDHNTRSRIGRILITFGRPALLAASVALPLAGAPEARAEMQFSAYGGWQGSPDSDVEVTGAGAQSFEAEWSGKSFQMPPYWGVRGTWWLNRLPKWGLSIDFTHAKVYATEDTLASAGWSRLEFTDGLNILTLNAMRRFEGFGRFEPYVGAGVGLSIPHVEVDRPTGSTFNYQVGGPALEALAGVNYKLNERFSLFTEYQFSYTWNDVEIDSGSNMKVDIATNALVFGASIHF